LNHPLVYIIILNWNGKDLTRACLQSLERVRYDNFKILVVDNGSTDDSVAMVREEFPQVEVLALPHNVGFAAGNNRGFAFVEERKPEFVIFLNNDTTVHPDFIQALIQPFEDGRVGQTVPKIFYEHPSDKLWYAGGKVNLWTGVIAHRGIRCSDAEKFNRAGVTDYATGCCFCMRRKDFATLQGFDESESFNMYGEDVDLSLRIRKYGKLVWYTPQAVIWHKVSASVGGAFSATKLRRKLVANIKLLSRHAKFYQWFTEICYLPIFIIVAFYKLLKYR
jgi:hypothetical protein